ncbi:MAG TPA: MFS transporter [Rhizomicrobium sp.]
MTVAVESVPRPVASMGAGIVSLLSLALFINYVDRGNLATAAPLMQTELKLSGAELGLLLSVFYWSYTPCQILAGWLSERISATFVLAIGLAIWSLATAATGLVSGFAALIALRLLLGVGESALFPCSSKLLAKHLPPHKLGSANGAIGVGLSLGPAFGTFVGGMLMARYGWRPVFFLFGIASLAWLVPWLLATHDSPLGRNDASDEPAPGFLDILRHREAWGACLGHFSANYAFYFVISWLPLYLVRERGFTIAGMSMLGGLIYLVNAASTTVSGWASDQWIRMGASTNRVRKVMIVASHAGTALAMLGCAFGNTSLAVASLFLAAMSFGPGTVSLYAIGQTLAGPRCGGKWIGVQNCVGNIAGIVAPVVTGFVIDRTGQFFWAFAIACAVALGGIFAWGLIIRRVAPVKWNPCGAV